MARDIKGQQFAAVRTKIHEVLQCLRPLGSHSPSWKRWNRSQAQSFGKAGQLLDPHGCTAKCVKSRDVEKVKGWKVAQAGSLSGLGALESCSCTGRPEHSYEATQSCSNEFVAWGWRWFCGPSRAGSQASTGSYEPSHSFELFIVIPYLVAGAYRDRWRSPRVEAWDLDFRCFTLDIFRYL